MKRPRLKPRADMVEQKQDAPSKRKRGNPKFQKGMKRLPNAGRQRGTPNKINAMVKEAITEAAARIGADGKGKDGVIGFFELLFRKAIKAKEYNMPAATVAKVLPHQIQVHRVGGDVTIVYRSPSEIRDALTERGIPIPLEYQRAINEDVQEAEVVDTE